MGVVDDVRDIMEEIVAIGNDYMREITKEFGKDITENSLALVITDIGDKFGFMVKNGRFRMVDGDEVENMEPTAVVGMTSGFFLDLIDKIVSGRRGEWEVKVWEGYQTYKVQVMSKDGSAYIHYRNLMNLVKWLYNKLQEVG